MNKLGNILKAVSCLLILNGNSNLNVFFSFDFSINAYKIYLYHALSTIIIILNLKFLKDNPIMRIADDYNINSNKWFKMRHYHI